MGARAGWCWISVVVMGRRFPVRLSLRPTRYVLQDKRRRVRITSRRCTVFGGRFSLSIWLDRRSWLSGKFMWSQAHVLHKECRGTIPPRTAVTRSKKRIRIYRSMYTKRFLYIYILSFVKVLLKFFSTTSCNLCDLYQCEWYRTTEGELHWPP